MIKRLLLILYLCIGTILTICCQTHYFRHYQVENGLSNNTVFSCVQDARGFVWMGTKDGLNRFDGYNYKTFRSDPNDPHSIGDNFIRSLYIDDQDQLYAGTRNGLYRYNAELENFTTVYKSISEVRDIKKDAAGKLWIVSGQTLVSILEQEKAAPAVTMYPVVNYFAATSIALSNKQLWMSSSDGLLYRYHPATNSFNGIPVFNETEQASRWIEKIYAAGDQSIFVATSNYGAKLLNVNTLETKSIINRNTDKTEIFARDFVQTAPHECWIATESGIFIYNMVTGVYTNLRKQFNNPYSISDNAVYTLCRDKEGGIWAGTYFGGINYYPRQYTSFEKYFPDYTGTAISGNAVREICEDQYGDLWVGTEDAGLNKFNKKNGIFTQFKPDGTNNGIAYPNIHGMLAKGNELWVGTFEHGLDILDIPSGKVVRHYPRKDSVTKFRSNFIVSISQTTRGEIFIGTREGLYRYLPSIDGFTRIDELPGNSFVHSIAEDDNGNLWIGTMGSGLFLFNIETKAVQHFTHIPGNKNSISSNSITTIFKDSEGAWWFGTEGGGLCKLNREAGTFTNYTMRDGLPGNTVFKILEDGHRQLWITTSRGLVCFNTRSNKMTVFTTANGLLSDQFNYNSGYKDSAGIMYFGSVKGMISFNPDRFTANEYVPPLMITAVQSNNDILPISKFLDAAIPLELQHDQSTFSIDFAALSFTAPEMTEYQYIMEGLDQHWTYLKTNRKVYFTNLAPGNYVFKVKAATSNGNWNPVATVLRITILPPFWKSNWAFLSYAIMFILLVYYLFRLYHQRLSEKTRRRIELMEHEKEKEIYDAKITFFTNIAHEIKTPLTLIKAPMESVLLKAGDNAAIGGNLRIMQRNTDRLIELTNQLLDFRRVETNGLRLKYETVPINEILLERFASFKSLADQRNIVFEIKTPPQPLFAKVDLDALQKILNNLFANALNYCKAFVEVELMPLTGQYNLFFIEFRNDGITVPQEMREKIFEPFFRLSETQNKNGSGIGLALSRSLAELHKGQINYREGHKGLNIFVLEIPIEQAGDFDLANASDQL